MEKQKKGKLRIECVADEDDWCTLWFSVLVGIIIFGGLTAFVIVMAITHQNYSVLAFLGLTAGPLVIGVGIAIQFCLEWVHIYREKVLTPEEIAEIQAQDEAEAEHQRQEYELRERQNKATPHEYIVLQYPTEADLPEGISYQELEQEVIRADIAYDKAIVRPHYDRATLRMLKLNMYIVDRQATLRSDAAIKEYEKTYGVKFDGGEEEC